MNEDARACAIDHILAHIIVVSGRSRKGFGAGEMHTRLITSGDGVAHDLISVAAHVHTIVDACSKNGVVGDCVVVGTIEGDSALRIADRIS